MTIHEAYKIKIIEKTPPFIKVSIGEETFWVKEEMLNYDADPTNPDDWSDWLLEASVCKDCA